MKKSLIALAVMTISGAAFAQSSVTMFGLVDVGYGTHKTTGPSSASIKSSGVMDGANAGSRIGFRGTEDLGGGLKAEFWVEQGIAPTNDELFGVRAAAAGHQVDGFSAGGSAAALSGSAGAYSNGTNRQTFLGVISGMGTVRIGYQYTNVYELGTLAGYAMGSEGVPGADKAHLHMNAQAGGTRANAITYISPSFNGLTLRAQIGSGSAGRDTYEASAANAASNLSMDKAKRTSIMAKYDQGPLSAAVAYTANNATASTRAAGSQTINAYGAISAAAAAATTNAAERAAKLTQFGASYNLGVAKIGLTMNQGDNGGTTTSTANSSFKSNNWSLTVPLGAFVPFVSTGTAKTTIDSTNVVTEDYKMTQYGARYSLSKRTTAYVMAGTTKNNAAGAAWTKDSKTVVGLAHSF
jgi:predicted porin